MIEYAHAKTKIKQNYRYQPFEKIEPNPMHDKMSKPKNDKLVFDYPKEPIGGSNPYWRCSSCKLSDPEINGRIDGHSPHCRWRKQMERKQTRQG